LHSYRYWLIEAMERQLVLTGKLNIDPFYTQFDEWLPSGEVMIRNCLFGDRTARTFGQPMMVGYLLDNFGHPIQLSQILNGFGIDSLFFMRGMPYISDDVRAPMRCMRKCRRATVSSGKSAPAWPIMP
jgi:alpha-mannosidase